MSDTNSASFRDTIRVIGFDLDQTLYSKSPEIDAAIQGYIYNKIAEHRDVSLAEAEQLFKERYQEGRGMSGSESLIDLGIPNARDIVQEALEQADIAQFLTPDAETLALLQGLLQRYHHIDLVTGSNHENAIRKLRHLELPESLFSHILTGDQAQKSTGEAYRKWLTLYPEFSPEQFLYIGDRVRSDYEIPHELGIQSVLVNIAHTDSALPVLQLPRLAELKDYL
jgi:FMN phosphatase YigB (HAD superfamily)